MFRLRCGLLPAEIKPPQIPVLRNRIIRGLSAAWRVAAAAISPMANAPRTFTSSVPTGNPPSRPSGSSEHR